jgi:geranylgeranyl pyrophosphate synthase
LPPACLTPFGIGSIHRHITATSMTACGVLRVQFDTDLTMEDYIQKSYYKTASLIAASCRASAIFSDVDAATKAAMFEYGRHLGLAFQVVDDILDFTRTAEQLGKPQVRREAEKMLVLVASSCSCGWSCMASPT